MKIITNSKLKKILEKDLENYKGDIQTLFNSDYLTENLLKLMYPNINENDIYYFQEDTRRIKSIKNKLEKVLKELQRYDIVEEILDYKEARQDLKDENSSFYKDILFSVYEGNFESPLKAEYFLKEWKVLEKISKLDRNKLLDMYYYGIKKVNISETIYDEYISISTRASVDTYKKNIEFILNNGEKINFDIQKVEIFSI
jgi:hypothetical protein